MHDLLEAAQDYMAKWKRANETTGHEGPPRGSIQECAQARGRLFAAIQSVVVSETAPIEPPEVREKGGALDEVCATNATFHLEQMSATHWWMAVECGGKRVQVNLHSKAAIKGFAETEDQ